MVHGKCGHQKLDPVSSFFLPFMENLKRSCTTIDSTDICVIFFSHLNFQSGSFFNSGETYINNFCKISKAQQIEVAQLFELVEQKWMIVQQNFCHGVNIEYPHFNLNTLFDGIISKGSNAPINGLASQSGPNFWQYVEQGFATGAKSIWELVIWFTGKKYFF